jgi:hypothetical protein
MARASPRVTKQQIGLPLARHLILYKDYIKISKFITVAQNNYTRFIIRDGTENIIFCGLDCICLLPLTYNWTNFVE